MFRFQLKVMGISKEPDTAGRMSALTSEALYASWIVTICDQNDEKISLAQIKLTQK